VDDLERHWIEALRPRRRRSDVRELSWSLFRGDAIPSVVASAVGSLVAWFLNHRGMKEIEALESSLKREEETPTHTECG
jgi:hypothetical protein